MPRGLQQRVALVLPVANAVVVEGGRLVAEVLAAHDIGIERQAAAFIDVVAEPDSEVGPLLGDVAMRGVVAVGVVLTAGGREPGLRDRRVGSGCRPCAAHRAGVLADSETVEPLALLEAGDRMHAVAAAGGGELGAATRDLGEVVGGAHLPQHRYVVGGHAPADRERVGCQPCPQHHTVGIGVARGDAQRERVAGKLHRRQRGGGGGAGGGDCSRNRGGIGGGGRRVADGGGRAGRRIVAAGGDHHGSGTGEQHPARDRVSVQWGDGSHAVSLAQWPAGVATPGYGTCAKTALR